MPEPWLTEIQPFQFYLHPEAIWVGRGKALQLSASFKWKAIAALLAAGCCTAPASAATITATVNAGTIKPLVVAMLQSLDLGSITLAPGTWSNATISLSQGGTLSCVNANTVCTGATSVAKYNVQGSNNQTVRISAPNVVMTNQSDATKTLTLVTDAPASVLLTSSGIPGVDFSIGGTITVSSTTAAGTYAGTFNVTCDY